MLKITDLTYRIEGRLLFDAASAVIARGWKVGLVGRNGAGKSTLLRLIREEADGRTIEIARGARMGFVAQEAAPSARSLIDEVLAADVERTALLAEAETATDGARIAEIHMRLADIEAHAAEARAAEILAGLGFRQDDLSRPMSEFSGGWRMRAALAGVLFSTPELLLLDEPTNYLDLEGAAWLEAHLRKYPHTVLVVSHDREMLNRSVTHILALDHGKLSVHPGGYDVYLRKRAEQTALLTNMRAKQDAERERLQAFVDRFRAKASKARQAQSRVKMLERMQLVSVPVAERTVPFHFTSGAELASPLVELEGAAIGYAPDLPVLAKVDLRVDQDDRIAIVGANGQGKTTLVKAIAGRLALLSGARRASKALKIGYFSQDQMDLLRAGETPLDHVRDLAPEAPFAKLRAMAAQLGFGPEKIANKVEKLSGGEKVRLLLGLATLSGPHILILDEPTSHLDIDSREALIHALNDYAGAVLLITHDVYLAGACADRVWLVNEGAAEPYGGDLDDYRALVLAADRARAPGPAKAEAPRAAQTEARPRAAKPNVGRLQRLHDDAERAMESTRAALSQIDAAIAAPGAGAQMGSLMRDRAKAQAALDAAEEAWLSAAEALAAAATAKSS